MKEDQIIEAARELFIKYGYKRVSMTEIAIKAQVTKKTLYSYFKDKGALLNYFIKQEMIQMKNIIDKIEKEDLKFLKKMDKVIYELLKYRKENNLLATITKEYESEQNLDIRENLKLLDKSAKEYIHNKIVLAIENEYIKQYNAEILTFIIYKVYVAVMFELDDEKIQLDSKEISDILTGILESGLKR